MLEFNSALEKISNLESQVNSFCTSISQSILKTTLGPSSSSSSSSFFSDEDNRGVSDDNPHNNPGKYTCKAHIVDASKLLQGMHERLSSAESSLVPLVDLFLDVEEEEEGRGGGCSDEGGAEPETSLQRSHNGYRKVHKLQLLDLSRQLRCLHALHAKQILHIESLLVSQHGYITSSQQEEENDDYPLMGSGPGPSAGQANDANSSSSPLSLFQQIHDQENMFQPTQLHGPLPRLSEVTMETDGGTPLSMMMSGRQGLENTVTPLSARPKNNTVNHTIGCGPLKSLKEEMNMEIMTLDYPQKDSIDHHTTDNEHINNSQGTDDSVSTCEADSDILKTPSLDKLHLSAATISILQKSNHEASNKSGEQIPNGNIDNYNSNMNESGQQSDSNSDESRDSSMFESCGNDESVYDSCEETFEDSQYLSTDESYEAEEDEDLHDATVSIASTVVRNVESLKVEGNNTENKCKFVGNKNGDAADEEKNNTTLTHVTVGDVATNSNLTNVHGVVRMEAKDSIGHPDSCVQIPIDPQKDLLSPHSGTIPATFLKATYESFQNTNDNLDGVSDHPIGQHIEELEFREGRHDTNKHIQTNEAVVTSPLDRFQVQVLNGGKECKVTPIGDDILRSAQSPILKSRSPPMYSSISSHDSHHTRRIQVQERVNLSHYDESIDTEETESFYSSSPSDNGLILVNTKQKNNRHSCGSLHIQQNIGVDSAATNIKSEKENQNHVNLEPNRSTSIYPINVDVSPIVGPHSEMGVLYTDTQQGYVPLKTSNTTSACCLEDNSEISITRTPRAAAFIVKHMSDEKDRLLGVLNKGIPTLSTEKNLSHKDNAETNIYQDSASYSQGRAPRDEVEQTTDQISVINLEVDPRLIVHVTADEYDGAPQIIKKLVSREDLNQGISMINNWLVSKDNEVTSLPESVALDILGEKFHISQVKRICLSLCSLQRMMISRRSHASGESVMHYVFLRKRNSTCA